MCLLCKKGKKLADMKIELAKMSLMLAGMIQMHDKDIS